jgi:hypothetical protein
MVSASGAVGALVAMAAVPVKASDASSQLRKEDVRYQDQPKGNQRCSGCKNFVGPNACRVVTGSVNPNGWCLLYQAKSS